MSSAPSVAMRPPVEEPAPTITEASRPGAQAFRILQAAFVVAPILAGLDKFLHLMTNWDKYLAPLINEMIGGRGPLLMKGVGVIEIAAGIGVLWKPRVFAYVVVLWLWAIVFNFILIPGYFDIMVRDIVLSIAALALGRLSVEYDRS